jgi:hypothetical protein
LKAEKHLSGYYLSNLFNREKCYQLHFDNKHFYIAAMRRNVEYFRKLKS